MVLRKASYSRQIHGNGKSRSEIGVCVLTELPLNVETPAVRRLRGFRTPKQPNKEQPFRGNQPR